MPINPYFRNLNYNRSQQMIENLVIESISIYGIDIYYIPRTQNNLDELWGEDNLSSFDKATFIEMYVKNVDGHVGDGKFLSKFGLEVREQMTFAFARKRFDQIRTQNLLSEKNYDLDNEDVDSGNPMVTDPYELEVGNTNSFSITFEKPRIGDLLFMPLTGKWYEIKYVKTDEAIFYQLGGLQLYEVDCEVFEYSSETFDTGISEIDTINAYSGNMLGNGYESEDDQDLVGEDDVEYLLESYDITVSDPEANNDLLKLKANDVVDFSQSSPFVISDSEGKW